MTKTYYHVTPIYNLDKINQSGIIPQICNQSETVFGKEAAVNLYNSLSVALNAVSNWLGVRFRHDIALAILLVEIPPQKTARIKIRKSTGIEYESQYHGVISPRWIHVHSTI